MGFQNLYGDSLPVQYPDGTLRDSSGAIVDPAEFQARIDYGWEGLQEGKVVHNPNTDNPGQVIDDVWVPDYEYEAILPGADSGLGFSGGPGSNAEIIKDETPTTGGGGGGGGGGGPTIDPDDPIWSTDPIADNPTDDWYLTDPVGYENAPPPEGDGEFVEGGPPVDTSWDWEFFRQRAPGDRQFGGYDPDYQAFERYIPGMDSPWGLPNVKGGNADFYQQQFLNQLRDEQGYQNRERAAQMRRQEMAGMEPQDINPEDMWSWAYGGKGLPETTMGTGSPSSVPTGTYSLNQNLGIDSGTSGSDIYAAFSPTLSDQERVYANKHLDYFDQLDLGGGREAVNAWLGANPYTNDKGWTATLGKIANAIYTPDYTAGGPSAPLGYANPV